jgi:hypothetical protein
MKLFNETRFPADLFRSVLDEERLTASAIMRITYDLQGTRLRPAAEQIYIVSTSPWDSPHGPFEHDQPFKRGGVDLFLWGNAYAPGGRPTVAMTVSIVVGDAFRRDARVFGPRTWERSGRTLVPRAPRAIAGLPLTLAYAFGGKSRWDGMEVPWPDNPEGMGFYVEEAQAEGQPLPMIEDPAALVQRWDDRPLPAGFGMCPLGSGPRLKSAVVLGDDGRVKEITPRMLNCAHPAMVAPRVDPGSRVTLLGVTPAGRLDFDLPARLPQAALRLGDALHERPLEIDQVGIDVEAGKVFVSYRFPFRYRFVPEQQRSVTLTLADDGGA